jgi:hypothetical protein
MVCLVKEKISMIKSFQYISGIISLGVFFPAVASAHNIGASDAIFVESVQGPAIIEFLYLGAKHMVTGYDHILFLFGVIFFLYKMRDVALYVTLFTIGHSTTLLLGVLGGFEANPYIVDAIIGLSVVYKAFDNMGGFKALLGVEPNTKVAVLIFGFFHGFGLATKLQDFTLSPNGLVTNILSFNVGVELGQILVLAAILILMDYWRRHHSFLKHAFVTNAFVMVGGFLLMLYQITRLLVA